MGFSHSILNKMVPNLVLKELLWRLSFCVAPRSFIESVNLGQNKYLDRNHTDSVIEIPYFVLHSFLGNKDILAAVFCSGLALPGINNNKKIYFPAVIFQRDLRG